MVGEIGEAAKLQQGLAGGRMVDGLVLEYPGEVVGDEDGMKSSGERGVYVGLWAVTDHPGGAGVAAVLLRERAIGSVMLLGQDLHLGEK